MPAKPLSPEQLEDAARLSKAFDDAKVLDPSKTQKAMATWAGWKTQGTVSHYLNGRIPLNLDALLSFSQYLKIDPRDISPTLALRLAQRHTHPDLADDDTILRIPIRDGKWRRPPVVGRGSGGTMPERIWDDGDHPVGYTGEDADVPSPDENAWVTEVVGPSMIPKYMPKQYALVEPNTQIDLEDDVLVRLKDGQTVLKRLTSRRDGGITLASYNDPEILWFPDDQVTWMYYVAFPIPRKKIKQRI